MSAGHIEVDPLDWLPWALAAAGAAAVAGGVALVLLKTPSAALPDHMRRSTPAEARAWEILLGRYTALQAAGREGGYEGRAIARDMEKIRERLPGVQYVIARVLGSVEAAPKTLMSPRLERSSGKILAAFKDPDALADVRLPASMVDRFFRYGEYVDVQFDLGSGTADVVPPNGRVEHFAYEGALVPDETFVVFRDSSAIMDAAERAGVDLARVQSGTRSYVRHGESVGIAVSSRGARVVPVASWPVRRR